MEEDLIDLNATLFHDCRNILNSHLLKLALQIMHVGTLEGNVVVFRVYHSFLLRNILRGIALQQMDTDTIIEQPCSNTYHITSISVRRLRKLEMCLICFLLTKHRGT